MPANDLRQWAEEQRRRFHVPSFVERDPVQVPRSFQRLQDVEIAAFFTTLMAWGRRDLIIRSAKRLMERMDGSPYEFVRAGSATDWQQIEGFVHRTLQASDVLYMLRWLRAHYEQHESLQTAFSRHLSSSDPDITKALVGFQSDFFSLPDAPKRTEKHISSPAKGGSACKRLCMFLRWLVRVDSTEEGVDLGLWREISPRQLIMPLDVHVLRTANRWGICGALKPNWQSAQALTASLRQWSADDPVRYDFAFFGAGEAE